MIEISPEVARSYMVGQAGLRAVIHPPGAAGVRAMLKAHRCVQLDPLAPLGTQADLMALARIDGIRLGDVYAHLYPGHAFEHFAKERCLLPASAFPAYRDQAVETPWWRSTARLKRVPEAARAAVLAEIEARGPLMASDLSDLGEVEAIDWSGWKGTRRMATMALEILWTQCKVVVCRRDRRGRWFDVPRRALPEVAAAPAPDRFDRWALLERVEAAGLLPRSTGPWWSMLSAARTSGLVDELLAEGRLVEVQIAGRRSRYLAPPDFLERVFPDDDGRMRIIGPLDPLIWCRPLVQHVFDFEYVWEVYKPAAKRRWGWYVCPLLHEGRLVGRFEGHLEGGEVVVDRLWREPGRAFDEAAFTQALARHGAACTPQAPG